jgi:hypothetical protein
VGIEDGVFEVFKVVVIKGKLPFDSPIRHPLSDAQVPWLVHRKFCHR